MVRHPELPSPIIYKARKMIVVAQFSRHYIALPVFTHNGNGLLWKTNKDDYVSILDHRLDPVAAGFVPQSRHKPLKTCEMDTTVRHISIMSFAQLSFPVSRHYDLKVVLEGRLDKQSTEHLINLYCGYAPKPRQLEDTQVGSADSMEICSPNGQHTAATAFSFTAREKPVKRLLRKTGLAAKKAIANRYNAIHRTKPVKSEDGQESSIDSMDTCLTEQENASPPTATENRTVLLMEDKRLAAKKAIANRLTAGPSSNSTIEAGRTNCSPQQAPVCDWGLIS